MIKDYEVGNIIRDEIFYCTDKSMGVSIKGDTYINITLRDKSGSVNCKIWDISPDIEEFEAKSFVKISGTVNVFKDNIQFNITRLSVVDNSEVNMDNFCPSTPNNIDDMYKDLMNFVESIKDEGYKSLLLEFFDSNKNPKVSSIFKRKSAAKSVHHAYIGGLLEHTLGVTKICDFIAKQYPIINRDLLLTSAMLHDIGKLKEISDFPDNDYTYDGNLLGHIYMGTEMIELKGREIATLNRVHLNQLKHCILAHHGALEYGSPKTPMLIEAQALTYVDDMDAKLRRMSDILTDLDSDCTDKPDFIFGSRIYKTK